MLVVEALLDHGSREHLFANLHFQFCAEWRILAVDKCHTYALVGRDGMVSCRHSTDGLSVFHHGIAMTGNRFVMVLNTHELMG